MPPRPYILHEANYKQLRDYKPDVAVLPWGATEAHNYHLPHGTDVIEASEVAERAAAYAHAKGGRPIVLPAIPFGNNAQQLDQVSTISFSTATAAAILNDVADSLKRQGLDKLILLNAHGGNDLKPLVRDLQGRTGMFVVVINFWQMLPEFAKSTFADPGDHAGELETSMLLHLRPDWVQVDQAGPGTMNHFEVEGLRQPGVWTPRPWSATHPDTGSGDPSQSTAEKGARYVEAIATAAGEVLLAVGRATKGQLPYV